MYVVYTRRKLKQNMHIASVISTLFGRSYNTSYHTLLYTQSILTLYVMIFYTMTSYPMRPDVIHRDGRSAGCYNSHLRPIFHVPSVNAPWKPCVSITSLQASHTIVHHIPSRMPKYPSDTMYPLQFF